MQPKINKISHPIVAVINEEQCIGCAKCIPACPADAILGSATFMHTVISDECIGCKLCIAPCPVDCISMAAIEDQVEDKFIRKEKADNFKKRYQIRSARLKKEASSPSEISLQQNTVADKKAYILAALERAKLKKASS